MTRKQENILQEITKFIHNQLTYENDGISEDVLIDMKEIRNVLKNCKMKDLVEEMSELIQVISDNIS